MQPTTKLQAAADGIDDCSANAIKQLNASLKAFLDYCYSNWNWFPPVLIFTHTPH